MDRALRLGITGGLASGKSTVVARFAALGATVIDTDAIAHALTAAGGAAIAPLRAAFGAQAIDAQGALDRAQLRALVFADPRQRARLERILHPMILAQCQALDGALGASAALLAYDVPLLTEAAAFRGGLRLDRVLVVDAPAGLQRARALQRSGLAEAQVRAVMASQAARRDRLALADDVLVNAGTLAELQERVDLLWRAYRRPAGAAHPV